MANQRKPKKHQNISPKLQKNNSTIQPDWFGNVRLHCGIILALCFLIYSNTITHEYTLDDAIVIYDNEFTMQGISGIDELLSYDTFRGFFKVEGKENLVAGGRYRPLTPIMFALGIEFFGKTPVINHFMNIVYYGLTCVILYLLLLKLLSPQGNTTKAPTRAILISLIAALIFTAHPIHTEVVANIKGRDEIITLLGSLAALYFSVRAYFEKNIVLHVLAGVLFFFGLLAKENAITFLAIVPLTFFVFTKANFKQIIILTTPYVTAAGIFLSIRFSILGLEIGEPVRELMNNPFLKLVGNQYVDFSFSEKMATIFYTLLEYLRLLIVPHPLTHDYYPRQVDIMSFGNWQVILSVLIYVSMGVYGLIRTLKKDPIGYGILFFLITLSIVSNIVFSVGTNMGERFIFMPSLGFCLILGVLGYRFSNRKNTGKAQANYSQIKPVLGILAIFLVLFSAKSFTRNFVWKDNFTLFTTDVHTSPNSAKVRNSAGGELIAQSIKPENESKKTAMLNEAVGHLKEAIRIHPGFKNAFLLLGNANNYLKNFEESIRFYNQALILDPNYQEAKNNLSITYREAGKFFGEQKGDLQKALENLNKAYDMKPDDYETLRLLGVAYGIGQNNSMAIDFFTKAMNLKPNDADAIFNLGTAYFQSGNQEKATEYFDKAKAINPNIEQERSQRR